MPSTDWLPLDPHWSDRLRAAERAAGCSWEELVALSGARLDFLQVQRLGKLLSRLDEGPTKSVEHARLAILGSSTIAHLTTAVQVAGLRRGLRIRTLAGGFGQYAQEALAGSPSLDAFAPTIIHFSLDARHLSAGAARGTDPAEVHINVERTLDRLEACWRAAKARYGAAVFQQTAIPALPRLLGSNEHRLAGSEAAMIDLINNGLRKRADSADVHLVDVGPAVARDGVRQWYDPALWNLAKQEVSPGAAPYYGDLVARAVAALQGRSAKCLVLDLDNTLWGGVIGDEGMDGIVLGAGSALGEGFSDVQRYARGLADRGIILAVCSKNDEAIARAVFDSHPEMILKATDIAAFYANWDDKALNLRRIARELNVGLDTLVFVDDNPFERNLIRSELPEVIVPEIPDDDPAAIPHLLSDAGYFEGLTITRDDVARSAYYAANRRRREVEGVATNLSSYLRGLDMHLEWQRFDAANLPRVVQLLNKTNQFNLAGRRPSIEDLRRDFADPARLGLQFRLRDRFGDSGIIAVLAGQVDQQGSFRLDDWVMSCRVFGRGVEWAALHVLAENALAMGAHRLLVRYVATGRNGMVRTLLDDVGFVSCHEGGGEWDMLDLTAVPPPPESFMIKELQDAA